MKLLLMCLLCVVAGAYGGVHFFAEGVNYECTNYIPAPPPADDEDDGPQEQLIPA
jgi:hypothetical protein